MDDWLRRLLGEQAPDLRDLEQRRKGDIAAYMTLDSSPRFSAGENDNVGVDADTADLLKRADEYLLRRQ